MAGKWHFAFCIDEKYAQYASVCIRSILMHNTKQELHIHILSDHLTEQAIKRLCEASESERCEITFHHINEQELNGLPLSIWPIQAWYRILLPDILSSEIDRVLYLDCDTLVLSDLSELFDLDLSDKAFAAVEDPQSFKDETYERCNYPKSFKYVCSGVMLFNLSYWRKHDLKNRIIIVANKYKQSIKFPDQDCLNMLCHNTKFVLPLNYGIMHWFFQDTALRNCLSPNELLECLRNPQIVHFASCAPWIKELRPSLFSDEWDKINRSMKHPAKVRYRISGMQFIKMIMYQILHPIKTYRKRAQIIDIRTANNIVNKLIESNI